MTKYAAFYCEENVWHLCDEPRFGAKSSRVVIISSGNRACSLWAQRAAPGAGAPVIWDYHVILVVRAASGWEVWDFDTTLAFPVGLSSYLAGTFPPDQRSRVASEGLSPKFRIIEAGTYHREFSSDRSHMRLPDGSWSQQPPSWPPIQREGAPSFMRWTMMEDGDRGVVSLDNLEQWFPRNG